jgi:AraC-like DNA-binding protein
MLDRPNREVRRTRGSHNVRSDWVCEINNVYQRVVGDGLDGDPTRLVSTVNRLKAELPAPANAAESLMLRQSLALFLTRFSRLLHSRFHVHFDVPACASVPPPTSDLSCAVPLSAAHVLDDWCAAFAVWFDSAHIVPAPLRARRILEERFREPITMAVLATGTSCSESSLRRQFRRLFGVPPAEYLARVRIRHGLCRLRETNDAIEDVARWAGYQSGNKFYARIRSYTGVRPGDIRAMDDGAFADLIAVRLSLESKASFLA